VASQAHQTVHGAESQRPGRLPVVHLRRPRQEDQRWLRHRNRAGRLCQPGLVHAGLAGQGTAGAARRRADRIQVLRRIHRRFHQGLRRRGDPARQGLRLPRLVLWLLQLPQHQPLQGGRARSRKGLAAILGAARRGRQAVDHQERRQVRASGIQVRDAHVAMDHDPVQPDPDRMRWNLVRCGRQVHRQQRRGGEGHDLARIDRQAIRRRGSGGFDPRPTGYHRWTGSGSAARCSGASLRP
jgi:hypothetical protein